MYVARAVAASCVAATMLAACSSSTSGAGTTPGRNSSASQNGASGSVDTNGPASSTPVVTSTAPAPHSSAPPPPPSSASHPSASTPSGPSQCTGAQLTTEGEFDEGGSAAGHERAILVFSNSSTTTCTLYGYPGVDGIPPHPGPGTVQHFTRSLRGMLGGLPTGKDTKPTVVLGPGMTASAIVEASTVPNDSTTDCTAFQNLKVTPPNTAATVTLPINELPSCNPLVHPVVAGSTG